MTRSTVTVRPPGVAPKLCSVHWHRGTSKVCSGSVRITLCARDTTRFLFTRQSVVPNGWTHCDDREEPIIVEHRDTFERIVRPHFDRLYRLAWRLTGRKAEAEDLFQELLIKAYGKIDDLVKIDEPGSWLCRVMYNLFIDEKRRFARRRLHTVEEGVLAGDGIEGLAGSDDPVRDNERMEKMRQLDAALSRLSNEHRLIVLLHDSEGYKLREIQDLIGVPVGTVKSRLHRARARLREILADSGTFF